MRLHANNFKIPWLEVEPCPCNSGKTYGACCSRGRQNFPLVELPTLVPPGGKSGYANSRCYLSSTENCCEQISREHYISEAILKEFSEFWIAGFPWQAPNEISSPGFKALTSKILCRRHNSALSPLDTFALKAFRAFTEAPRYVAFRQSPGKAMHFLVSGDALELWMIKLLCGFHYGRIATTNGNYNLNDQFIDRETIVCALTEGVVNQNSGLFLVQEEGTIPDKLLKVATLTAMPMNHVLGIRVGFGSVSFETTIMKPLDSFYDKMVAQQRHRPSIIDFTGVARDARIFLTWKRKRARAGLIRFEISPEKRWD